MQLKHFSCKSDIRDTSCYASVTEWTLLHHRQQYAQAIHAVEQPLFNTPLFIKAGWAKMHSGFFENVFVCQSCRHQRTVGGHATWLSWLSLAISSIPVRSHQIRVLVSSSLWSLVSAFLETLLLALTMTWRWPWDRTHLLYEMNGFLFGLLGEALQLSQLEKRNTPLWKARWAVRKKMLVSFVI